MAHVVCLLVQLCCAAAAFPFPHSSFRTPTTSRRELESSASGPDEPVREVVRVLQLDPQSGLFRRGLTPRGAPSLRSRLSFPAFLSQGRVGPAFRAPLNPLNHLQPNPPAEMEAKKRKGLQMWQRALGKADKTTLSLPVNLKDTKQTCTAVPFTQVRTKCFTAPQQVGQVCKSHFCVFVIWSCWFCPILDFIVLYYTHILFLIRNFLSQFN